LSGARPDIPEGVTLLGDIPENTELAGFDREGKALWLLPDDNGALEAVRMIAHCLRISFKGET
jgi:hypothetical protein